MASASACPHCGVVLDPPPKQSRKCPDCRESIVVRTDPDSKAKLLLTEFGAEEFDQAKKARSARNKVLRRLPILGLEEGNYLLEERRLSKQFGRAPSPGDVYWGLANSTLQQLVPSPGKNAHQIKQIYWQMGLHLLDEGRSREQVQRQQRESHRWDLTDSQKGWQKVGGTSGRLCVVRTDKGTEYACCEPCTALEGAEYTYKDALDKLPLPQAECEKDWCTCMWAYQGADAPFDSDPAGEFSIEYEDLRSSSSGASQGCLTSTAAFVGVLLLAIAGVLAVVGV